jgi:DNA repair protein RadC
MSIVKELERVKRYEIFIRKTDEHPHYQNENQIGSPEAFYDFLIRRVLLDERPHEKFVVLALSKDFRIRGYSIVASGSYDNLVLCPSNIFQFGLSVGASALVLAHNHPSGNPQPSMNDIRATNAFIDAGEILGIPVVDHLIISEDAYYSMAEECNETIFNVEGEPNKNVV